MRTLSCSMWDLVPRPGIEPGPPALRRQSLNCWISRRVHAPGFWRPQNASVHSVSRAVEHPSEVRGVVERLRAGDWHQEGGGGGRPGTVSL